MNMKLREILNGHNQVYVAEYLPEDEIGYEPFVGGCFYADGRLISLDGKEYELDVEVASYQWRDRNDVKVWLA